MKKQWICAIGTIVLLGVWLTLTGFVWFGGDEAISTSERRPLRQLAEVFDVPANAPEDDDSFMERFDKYAQDQFPVRDGFRKIKALFHYYVMQQKDNNNIYITQSQAAQLHTGTDLEAVKEGTKRFQWIYENFLKSSNAKTYVSVIPDKGYYLAEPNGYLSMDYDKLMDQVRQDMPWAKYLDITDTLDGQSYYRTDHHWRQEALFDTASALLTAMGAKNGPSPEDFTKTPLERPFYGTYYGQASLPMDPETIYTLESKAMEDCTVTGHDKKGKPMEMAFYNEKDLESKDLYDIFLSGTEQTLVFIENPNANTDKHLIVFRDSYGCALAPLLIEEYAKISLVDIRTLNYRGLQLMGVDFQDADVLFLYSTLVLNNPDSFHN